MMKAVRLSLIALWLMLWVLPIALARACNKKKLRGKIINLTCGGMLRACGVRTTIIGKCAKNRPLLVVSNHISYLDVLILGSAMDCRFVPKKEIAGWPVIGWLCKIQDAVFVDRSPAKIAEGREAMTAAFAAGEIVSLFPEATTGEGKHMLPFKPAFFEAARGVMVQPVAICYRKINGLPMDYGQWPHIAWYGDMELLPHLWHLLSLGKIEVELHFLPPISSIGQDRKTLATQAQEAIAERLPVTSCQLPVAGAN